MAQYGVLVYLPAPAEPAALSSEYLDALAGYTEQAKQLGGKVLGGSYFAGQRGFAFESSETATSITGGTARSGSLVSDDLVPAAFFVLSAPSQEAAAQIAALHPATSNGGGVEVRKLFPEPKG